MNKFFKFIKHWYIGYPFSGVVAIDIIEINEKYFIFKRIKRQARTRDVGYFLFDMKNNIIYQHENYKHYLPKKMVIK
jgi:hypothetical protein